MFQLLNILVEASESGITLLRFLLPCALISLIGLSLINFILDAVARAKQMHQIPCTQCRFFTNDHRLKCTIQPQIANTEQAIDCSDYRSD
ncbi:hypothetical protein STA3757_46810 [Stanieria sp. NIES-3757]|nr:hypothetical protein STA3757_46810 [Stanieria sp. NIES-3757]